MELDEDGYADLGNAVLAAWLIQIPRRLRMWKLDRDERERTGRPRPEGEQELIEAGERRELRDLLDYQGALDDAFGGPFKIDGDYKESLEDVYLRWEAALQSAEAFAVVAVKDIVFPSDPHLPTNLRVALSALSPAERRTPIARLGPCPITRELRLLVLDYFRGVIHSADVGETLVPGRNQVVEDLTRSGVDLVRRKVCPSARSAAIHLVDKHGFSANPVEAFEAGSINAASREAAIDRLGRFISKALKS